MRTVSSAFWAALQTSDPRICELISLATAVGTFNWTSTNQPLVSSGVTYDPFPGGSAKGAEESTELTVGQIGFTIANSGPLASLIKGGAIRGAALYVRRVLVNSPDLGNLPVWRGDIADIGYNRMAISGTSRNQLQSATRNWPYHTYMDTCVNRFGDVLCGLDVSSFTLTLSLAVSSSTPLVLRTGSGTLTQSFAPGQLERGRVTVLTGPNSGQVRVIRTHTGDLFALSHSLPFPHSGATQVSIQRGCRKRLFTDCISQFNNGNRHFASPWMPKQEQAF
jgi:uncharacterized phage protein (TIGR02218 family)